MSRRSTYLASWPLGIILDIFAQEFAKTAIACGFMSNPFHPVGEFVAPLSRQDFQQGIDAVDHQSVGAQEVPLLRRHELRPRRTGFGDADELGSFANRKIGVDREFLLDASAMRRQLAAVKNVSAFRELRTGLHAPALPPALTHVELGQE